MDEFTEDEVDALAVLVNGLLIDAGVAELDEDTLKDMIDDAIDTPEDMRISVQSASFGSGNDQAVQSFDVAKFALDAAIVSRHVRSVIEQLEDLAEAAEVAVVPSNLPKDGRAKLADALDAHLKTTVARGGQIRAALRAVIVALIKTLRG